MNNRYLLKWAAIDALGTAAYVFLVSQIMSRGEEIFGNVENNHLAPMVFLMLFLFSALVTAYLVLGKPIMMYVDGLKKEAVRLLFYTGAALFIVMVIGLIIILAGK